MAQKINKDDLRPRGRIKERTWVARQTLLPGCHVLGEPVVHAKHLFRSATRLTNSSFVFRCFSGLIMNMLTLDLTVSPMNYAGKDDK
jgi:hypothetical protein